MQMIARKRVKYPHGHAGKEYSAGQTFTALSERDARALYVAGKADYDKQATAKNVTDLPAKPGVAAKALTAAAEPSRSRRNTYNRTDMQAAPVGELLTAAVQSEVPPPSPPPAGTPPAGQTGETTSSPSSPPDLLPADPALQT